MTVLLSRLICAAWLQVAQVEDPSYRQQQLESPSPRQQELEQPSPRQQELEGVRYPQQSVDTGYGESAYGAGPGYPGRIGQRVRRPGRRY